MRVVEFASRFVLLAAFLCGHCNTVGAQVCYESTQCRGQTVEMENNNELGDCCDGRGLSFSLSGSCKNCFSMEEFCNDGSEFYVAFLSNLELPAFILSFSPPVTSLMINNMETTAQTVAVSYKSGEKSVTIEAGSSNEVNLPASVRFRDSGETENGVLVQSANGGRLSVTAFDADYSSSDTYQVLPYVHLPAKYEYYAMCVDRDSQVVDEFGVQFIPDPLGNSVLVFIASESVTRVTLTPSQNVQLRSPEMVMAGTSIEFVLSRGEAVFLESMEDLSGTHVVSNKPLAFFSGHECGNMPSNQSYCDHMVEQLPPTATWGREFYTGSFITGSFVSRYRAISSRDSTSLSWICTSGDGGSSNTIDIPAAGQVVEFEIPINQFCRFTSTLPVLLVEFTVGAVDTTTTDPSMALVPPVGQYKHSYMLNYFAGRKNYVNILLPNAPDIDTMGVRLNGAPISGTWTNIPCGNDTTTICAYGIQVDLDDTTVGDGTLTLSHVNPEALLLGMPYSTDIRTGRSSFAGMTQKPIALDTISLSEAEYATEESEAEVIITIIRSGLLMDNLTVLFVATAIPSAPNTAIGNGEDFTEVRREVTLPAGETQVTVAITLGPDDIFPGEDKVFQVYLGPAPGAFIHPTVQANVTIADLDPALPLMNISFVQTSYTIDESRGFFEIVLTKSEGARGPVTVTLTPFSETALNGADFQLEEVNITFEISETRKVVPVIITNDDVVETAVEEFRIVITPVAGVFPLAVVVNVTRVEITDDDILLLAFEPGSMSIREDDGDGMFNVDLAIVKGSTSIDVFFLFPLNLDGTATEGSDYAILTESLVFSQEVTRTTIPLRILSDVVCENKEYFLLEVELGEGFFNTIRVLNNVNVTIMDDDCDLVVQVRVSSVDVIEDEGGVDVTLSIDTGDDDMTGNVTLGISTTPITNQRPVNFEILTQRQVTLTGTDSETVRIGITDDEEYEAEERSFAVVVDILDTTYDSISLSNNNIEIMILEQDQPPSREVTCTLLGDTFTVETEERCCIGGGESYEKPPYSIPCIVVGFEQTEYTVIERAEPYEFVVEVRPIRSLSQDITVTIVATPITADASDYTVLNPPWVRLVDGSPGTIQVAISTEPGQNDRPGEQFRLEIIEESGITPNNVFFAEATVTIEQITDQP